MIKLYFKMAVILVIMFLGIIIFNSILKLLASIMIYIVGTIALVALIAVAVLPKRKQIYYREYLKGKISEVIN